MKLTIDGSTNQVFSGGSGGIGKTAMYRAAIDFFLDNTENTITQEEFFCDNKFSLVLDLRVVNDKNVISGGKQIFNTQDGISIEIEKKATGKDLTCYMFVVSDGLINITDKTVTHVSK